MKRLILLTLFITAIGTTAATAQTPPSGATPGTGTGIGQNFVDTNGDGICDYYQNGTRRGGNGQQAGKRGGYGPGDGTGRGIGPRDGTGYGPGARSGNCTGTGPQGAQAMRGRARGRQ